MGLRGNTAAFVPVTLFELRNFICDFTGKALCLNQRSPEEDLTGGKDVEL